MYTPSIFHPKYQHETSSAVRVYDTFQPDVKPKKLPFFELLGELLKPTLLLPRGPQSFQEGGFLFHLTTQQVNDISASRKLEVGSKLEYVIQVQLRFCLVESSSEQEDCFPQGVGVQVNGIVCSLPRAIPTNKPGVEPKRPPQPVNITSMVCLIPNMPNHVSVSWNVEHGKAFAVAIYLVRKMSSSELLQRLMQRGIRPANYTSDLIKDKIQEDVEYGIAATCLKVSLLCPLGKIRMTTPCRALSCHHLQCFDASLYLQMNERKSTWMCPVCDKPAVFDNLMIDGYFQHVLDSGNLKSCNEIQLHEDGSWSSLIVKDEQSEGISQTTDTSVVKIEDDVVALSENHISEQQVSLPPGPKKEPTVIDLTFSDSDDGSNSVKKVESCKKRKVKKLPMRQCYLSRLWNKDDAKRALDAEIACLKGMKNDRLMIRFPDSELNEDLVKNFFPGIENVYFQTFSCPRYCFVQLAENINPNIAIKELSKIKFGNGKLLVERMFSKEEEDIRPEAIDPYTLCIEHLPTNNVSIIREIFPTASQIDVLSHNTKSTWYAFIHYTSVDDAIDAFKRNHNFLLESRNLIVRFRRMKGPIVLPDESHQQKSPKKDSSKDESDNEDDDNSDDCDDDEDDDEDDDSDYDGDDDSEDSDD